MTLVRDFDRNSSRQSAMIRDLVRRDRQAFYANALEILLGPDESSGFQFLISILAENELLVPAFCDPALTQAQALALARIATLNGQMVDVAVAHYLTENASLISEETCPPGIQRLMELLAEISDGSRILPSLMTLARQPNPYLQSKAVLIIGRINRNVKWILHRLQEPDARVRANAVEALWGLDTEESRHLLRGAARDGNNRVAGNALVALHRLGDSWCIPELMEMAAHPSRRFRATAAWVMGQTGDSRFTKSLGHMIAEPNFEVRSRAFDALGLIRTATAAARQAGEWRVLGGFHPSRNPGWRELQMEVRSKDGLNPVDVVPTQFMLSEDGQGVLCFTVERHPVAGILSVGFIYPRTEESGSAFEQGALRALAWKRPRDLWSAVPYRSSPREALTAKRPEENFPIHFTDDPKLVAEAFSNVPPEIACADLWSTIRRSILSGDGQEGSQRHLIVLSEAEAAHPASDPKLGSSVLASHIRLHTISLTPNAVLENLCQKSKGTFRLATARDEVADCVEQAYLSLVGRYVIRYQMVSPGASTLTIKVQSRQGWGETRIPIPPETGFSQWSTES